MSLAGAKELKKAADDASKSNGAHDFGIDHSQLLEFLDSEVFAIGPNSAVVPVDPDSFLFGLIIGVQLHRNMAKGGSRE